MGRNARRYGQSKGLSTAAVLVQDQNPTSQYFKIHELPAKFTAGKNLFKIEGNRQLLEPNEPILVEILDFNGNPIYHDVVNYLEPETNFRYIVPWIYPDTAGGPCTIYIGGIARFRPNGKSIPPTQRNVLNVRWSREVPVSPSTPNTTPILNLRTPRLQIREKIRNYVTPVSGQQDVQRVRSASVSYELEAQQYAQYAKQSSPGLAGIGGFGGGASTKMTAPPAANGIITTSEPFFSSSMAGASIKFPGVVPVLPSNQTLVSMEPPTNPPFRYQEISTQYYEPVIQQVINNKRARVNTPLQVRVKTFIPQQSGLKGTSAPPLESFDVVQPESFANASATCSYVDYNVPFTTNVTNTVSFAKIALSNIEPECGQIRQVRTSMRSVGFHQWQIMDIQDLACKELFTDDDSLGLQQRLGFITTQSILKTYWKAFAGRPGTTYGTFQYHTPEALTTNPEEGAWRANIVKDSEVNVRDQGPKLLANDDVLTDAVTILAPDIFPGNSAHSDDTVGTNAWDSLLTSESFWEITWNENLDIDDDGETDVNGLEGGIYVNAGNTYQVSFKLALAQAPAGGTGDNSSPTGNYVEGSADYNLLRQPKVNFALTGSAFNIQNYEIRRDLYGGQEIVRQYPLAEFDFRGIINSSTASVVLPEIVPGSALDQANPLTIDEDSPYALALPTAGLFDTGSTLLGSSNTVVPDVATHVFEFTPPLNGYMNLAMQYYGGDVTISEFSVKALDLRGFTPNHTYIEFEVPSYQSDDVLEFKFDLIDNNANIVSTFTTRSSAFVGSNQFLDNGQITGNVVVGDGIVIQGFEG